MALRLRQLEDTNRPALEALLKHVWEQNWGAELASELIRWRYYDRPAGGITWLACDDDQCVAMVDSFVRPYLLEGRRILVRETCDWYCLPKYRPLGLGIKLMREMMSGPEPVLSIGGAQSTLALLPRLRWKRLPDVQKYVLPLKARGFAGVWLRSRWPAAEAYARAIPPFIPLRRPRRAPAPRGGLVAEWRPGADAPAPLPQGEGLVQLLEQLDHEWIGRMPSQVAKALGLVFFVDDRPIGVSLSQIEPAVAGLDGCIVHLQLADQSQALANWVVAETAQRLAASGVGVIRCSASDPVKIAALRNTGFLARELRPTYWWPKSDMPTPARIDAGYLRADDAIPFPALHGRHLAASRAVPSRTG